MERKLELKMEEEEPFQVSSSRKIKQSISVPFVWEIIPGTPKKDWIPTTPPTKPTEPPVRLIEWEEKPGKQLPYGSQPPPISPLPPPQAESNRLQAQGKLIASVPFEWEEKPGKPLPSCLQQSLPASSPLAPPQGESNRLQAEGKLIATVPFEWEEKPGKPLPSCLQPIPTSSPVVLPKAEMSSIALPGKLIVSVPFEWEEKPGTPLPFFLQPPLTLPLALPPDECNSFPSLPGHSEGNGDHWISRNDRDGGESEILESDTETCEYETDDGSFSSVPSFSANSIPLTMAIPCALPTQQSPPKDLNSGELQSPGSPASETESTCSYATGTASLVGASFLEWLFPLLAPRSSFLDKVGYSETVSQIEPKKQITDLHQEKHYTATIRRPPTLGELIMMSQRRSYQRKAIQMQKQNLSKEIMKRNAVGRNIFDTSNILGRFDMKWKRQLQLKLM